MSALLAELMAKRAACSARIKELEEERQKALSAIDRLDDDLGDIESKEDLIAKLTGLGFKPEQIEEAAKMYDILKACTFEEIDAMLKPPV